MLVGVSGETAAAIRGSIGPASLNLPLAPIIGTNGRALWRPRNGHEKYLPGVARGAILLLTLASAGVIVVKRRIHGDAMKKSLGGIATLAALIATPVLAADLSRPMYSKAPPPPPVASSGVIWGVRLEALPA